MLKALDQLEKRFGSVNKSVGKFKTATDGIHVQSEKAGSGLKKLVGNFDKFASSLARIAKYRVLRSILKGIADAFKEGTENLYYYSAAQAGEAHRMAASLDAMATANQTAKNQIGSAWGEILSIILPVIQRITQAIASFADWLSQLFAAFGGNSKYYKAVDASARWAKNTASGAKSAKEMRRQLMGFDEINRLDAPTEPSGGGGGGSAKNYGDMFDYIDIDGKIAELGKKLRAALPLLELAWGGFELALGTILLFSGASPLLGLALMAIGAKHIADAVKEDWSKVPADVARTVTDILSIGGALLTAVGIVMLFAGHPVMGIGMIIAGGALMATASVAWGSMTNNVKGELTNLMGLGSLLLMGLGIVLMMAGHPALGIAMLIAGGAMGVAAIVLNWDYILDHLKTSWKNIKTWWHEHVSKYLTIEYWDSLLGDGILAAVEGFGQKLEQFLQPVVDWLDKLFAPRSMPLQVDLRSAGGLIGGGMAYIPQFATGGFPEDGLFMANHGELVGQFSNGQTAVANNEQIISGIERGVYNAMTSALAGQSGNRDIRVYLDGKEIGAATRRYERNMNRATGVALG